MSPLDNLPARRRQLLDMIEAGYLCIGEETAREMLAEIDAVMAQLIEEHSVSRLILPSGFSIDPAALAAEQPGVINWCGEPNVLQTSIDGETWSDYQTWSPYQWEVDTKPACAHTRVIEGFMPGSGYCKYCDAKLRRDDQLQWVVVG